MPSNFYFVTMQERNQALVQAVNRFLDDRNDRALTMFFRSRSPGEQVMLIGYLVKGEMPGMARELEKGTNLSLATALSLLDRENGTELARLLGWQEGHDVYE